MKKLTKKSVLEAIFRLFLYVGVEDSADISVIPCSSVNGKGFGER
jgi:hypothetical protein